MDGSLTRRPRKARSFTPSRPPPSKTRKPRIPLKRSKTYTGCWTCRGRGVKCDEQRPACQRCLRSKLCCEGYHVKLVWDDEHGADRKPAERRTFLIAPDARQPVLSSTEILQAIETLDTCDVVDTVQVGPFAVFSTLDSVQGLRVNPTTHLQTTGNPFDELSFVASDFDDYDKSGFENPQCHGDGIDEIPQDHGDDIHDIPPDHDYIMDGIRQHQGDSMDELGMVVESVDPERLDPPEAARIMMSIKQKVLPHVGAFLSCASLEERSLFHYWVTYLSGLMIPTRRLDNPFRTIFIPLALCGSSSPQESSGNTALLHAIYAISAFNRARVSSDEHLLRLGRKHHKEALRHLRGNLIQPDENQQEAILATIITMSSIEIINGESASYRTHLAGGTIWLQAVMKKGLRQSPISSLLCQLFFCMNALAPPGSSPDPKLPRLIDQLEEHQSEQMNSIWPIWDTKYALDKLFGITRPVLEGIVRINALSDPNYNATKEELDDLDVYIRRNDPDLLLLDLDKGYDTIIRHHTCAFFCASLIHFERQLRKTSPRRLQRLVQRGLEHLEAIRALEEEGNLDVCGLFWPEFIIACEAEDVRDLRSRAIALFGKGRLRGIGNILSAERVVHEVWQRRDHNYEGVDITWHATMRDLGIDILLA